MIEVEQLSDDDPKRFRVTLRDDVGEARFEVTMRQADMARYVGQNCPPARCVEAAFAFLLDREPRQSILKSFDLSVIPTYFPEFAEKLPDYVAELDSTD